MDFINKRDYSLACIAFGTVRFDVRCTQLNLTGMFEIGSLLKLKGKVDCSGSPFHFAVKDRNDIEVIPGENMTRMDLKKAVCIPRKRIVVEMVTF